MKTPEHNPFHQPDAFARTAGHNGTQTPDPPAATGSVRRPPARERVERTERVDKPWGYEEIFAVLEHGYVGKVLVIRAGAALSLQRHTAKEETLAVQQGEITIEYGLDPARLETVTLRPGQRLLIRAGIVHRVTAVTDSRVLEASTAHPGWRNDIQRLDDAFGRTGTTAP